MYKDYQYDNDVPATRPWASFFLLLLGIFSRTKIFLLGSVGISELAIFPIAPLLFLANYKKLKRDGFMPLIWMLTCLVLAVFVSSFVNQSPLPYFIKAFAVFYSIICHTIVFHALIRNNYKNMYLFWVGYAISSIITLFGFNVVTSVSDEGFVAASNGGAVDIAEAMTGQMFWMGRLRAFGQIPIFGWYLNIPILYSVIYAVIYSAVLFMTTVSGRSAIATTLLGTAIIVVARKSRIRMADFGRHIWKLIIIALSVLVLCKLTYSFVAEKGLLSEAALVKYEGQTQGGKDIVSMLMSSRQEMFIDFYAAINNPIFGLGPHPTDEKGYAEKFVTKYGSDLDCYFFRYRKNIYNRIGMIPPLPLHSIIAESWVQYGIFGFIFWIWVLWLVYNHMRKYMAVIPQWFGYFAMSIPLFLWDLFFSPLVGRNILACFFVCLFFAKGIGQGRLALPYAMEREARKYE